MKILTTLASIVLIVHGLIYLMGKVAYLKLIEIKDLLDRQIMAVSWGKKSGEKLPIPTVNIFILACQRENTPLE